MNVQKQEKGFTIIEVVLVLAIAALIFLMIFVALPALQRGQRDTARKNDVNAIAAAINTNRSNNRGSLDKLTVDSITGNISQIDPAYVSIDSRPTNLPANLQDAAVVYKGKKCDTSDGAASDAVTTGSARGAAIVFGLENGGVICQDA